jgi:uncharacterized protein DUF4288
MRMRSAWKWFGVRTLYRLDALGRPLGRDGNYSPTMTLVEERVVVLKARSTHEAIQKAEADARRYVVECRHRNPYGQRVRTRYLGYCDAYRRDKSLGSGAEVFSASEVVPRRVTDRAVVRRLIGSHESKRATAERRNILDVVFNPPAPGVALTASERSFAKRHGTLRRTSDR